MTPDHSPLATPTPPSFDEKSLPGEDSDIVLFHSTAAEFKDHQFSKTDPRSVFILALIVAACAVLGLALAHWLMLEAIDAGWLSAPPALQGYVDQAP